MKYDYYGKRFFWVDQNGELQFLELDEAIIDIVPMGEEKLKIFTDKTAYYLHNVGNNETLKLVNCFADNRKETLKSAILDLIDLYF